MYSILLELPYFDPVRTLLIDPMHNLFLGTLNRATQKFWIEKQLLSSSHLQIIHKRLSNIAVPSALGRLPLHIALSQQNNGKLGIVFLLNVSV